MSDTLPVVDVWPTMQGEGPYSGQPAVFVRLGECSLRCTWCDTDFDKYELRTIYQIAAAVDVCRDLVNTRLVVVTGGEPYLHNLDPLFAALWSDGLRVQVESSASVRPKGELWERATTVVSPKTPIIQAVFKSPSVIAWKYVVDLHDTGLPAGNTQVPGQPGRPAKPLNKAPVYLQPLDYCFTDVPDPAYTNELCRAHVVNLCLQTGYRLSLQLHKELKLK